MEREDDDTQFQQFMAIQNAEEQARENQRKHEAEVEQNRLKTAEEMERLKWENAKELSDEKVWALNGGDAAVAYAENKYSSEAEREASERLEAQRREMEARLEAERASRDSEHRENQSQMFLMNVFSVRRDGWTRLMTGHWITRPIIICHRKCHNKRFPRSPNHKPHDHNKRKRHNHPRPKQPHRQPARNVERHWNPEQNSVLIAVPESCKNDFSIQCIKI